MKKSVFTLLILVFGLPIMAQNSTDTLRKEVLLETDMGNIRVVLYNETPLHRDNFVRLVKSGYYNGTLFHRVIANFMIQGGDSTSRHAKSGEVTGLSSPNYTLPAEIVFPKYFHKRGALAAAREGDNINPKRESSSAQFYIVYGRRMTDYQLDAVQIQLDKETDSTVKLTPEMRETYYRIGGTPHLDGQYTVFGEVVEGLDVVDRIQMTETDERNRPIKDIRIIRARIIK
jgi:peptidyl-prolyl cis-trans isomerase